MADDDNMCSHEGCTCVAVDGGDYCSPYCETADQTDVTSLACECGHPNCAAA